MSEKDNIRKKVAFIINRNLRMHCDKLPTMHYRATRIHELILSYKLLIDKNIILTNSTPATDDELLLFHTREYVEFIKKLSDREFIKKVTEGESAEDLEDQLMQHGLEYDCPILSEMYDFICAIAGGSVTAAKVLLDTETRLAINWYGGWHHAHKDSAEGFCYVNDIVIAIEKLKEKYAKVLYLDLDVHHGNGVQKAFELSKTVLTLSFHKFSPGFFPGTGLINDIGSGDGEFYSINVPLLDGVSDRTYKHVFESVFPRVFNSFNPSAMVVQCGGDIIKDDPIGQCNVTLETMGDCIRNVLDCNIPTMFLGGGGYNFQNTARYWTYLTSIILGTKICDEIPDDSEFFTEYSPTYELQINPGNMKDKNTNEYLTSITNTIVGYCDKIKD